MAAFDTGPSFDTAVPLFPLPKCVLLPGAILPLQVFEPRYRAMVRDTLEDQGLIAIALLRPGFEAYYYTNLAEIHPVVGVGGIREHLQVPDGRYFVNLLGLCRARIRQEDRNGEYRVAMLDPMIRPDGGIEIDGEYGARDSLRNLLSKSGFDELEGIEQVRRLLGTGGDSPLDDAVDAAAAALLPADAVEVKQRILEEMNVVQRTETLVRELRTLHDVIEARRRTQEQWPRFGSMN